MTDEPRIADTLRHLGAQVLVRGWLSANNIVFSGLEAARTVLVDTGYGTHAGQTVALVRQVLGSAPLDAIVNTHLHSDHCGGNAELGRQWPGATLAVPAGYRDRLQPWDESRLSYRDTDQVCEPFRPDHYLAPGTTEALGAKRWEVHATPGHDPDAVVFFEPGSRVLISGDALWEERLAIIFPELAGEPGFAAAHRALDLIERLAPLLVIPGHGQPFTGAAAAIARSRQRLEAFTAAPERHRLYAARALVSYHMLERRTRGYDELVEWMTRTPVFRRALQCEGDDALARGLAAETVDRLVAEGMLRRDGDRVVIAVEGRAG